MEVRVKELEWEDSYGFSVAKTPLGDIVIRACPEGCDLILDGDMFNEYYRCSLFMVEDPIGFLRDNAWDLYREAILESLVTEE